MLLADDQAAFQAQTIKLLNAEFEIIGSVGNGLDLINAAARLDPDVVVLDITMPEVDGIEAARQLQRAGCRAKLVFLTAHDDPDYVNSALDAGGSAYIVKNRMVSDLVPAIRAVIANRRFVSPTISLDEKA